MTPTPIHTRALYLDAADGSYTITNEKGEIVSLSEARRRSFTDEEFECNQSFMRLAQYGFDIDALKTYYAELA